ncbi:hypothetical protein [Streptococcus danieliae]
MDMKIKKYTLLLSMFLVFLGMIYIYIQYNLTRYSVYYASYMPRKEGAKPELVMALEHIDWVDKQNTENIRFDEGDDQSIYIKRNAYFTYNIEGYYLRVGKKNELYFYNTDSTGKFVTYSSLVENKNEEPLDGKTIQKIENLLVPATRDIIEAQKRPTINLQKLFNQRYMSRFN